MDEASREALAVRTVEMTAGAGEAIVTAEELGLTRFTNNAIHQNIAERNASVRIRTIVDGKTGVAATNDHSDAGLRALVERARQLASVAPRDEAATLVQSRRPAVPAGAYDGPTARFTPQERALRASEIFALMEHSGLRAAGYVASQRHATTIANSLGTLASYDGTTVAANLKASGADSTGYAEFYGNAASGLDAERAAAIAAQKALLSAMPGTVEPGTWTVILEPAAFGELLAYLTGHFSAQSYEEGSSLVTGVLGSSVAGDNVTIYDDFSHPLFAGRPFDDEGVPTERVALVDRGIARSVVTDSRYAARLGCANSGHASPAPSAHGPQVRYAVVEPGEKSLDRLIAETERGLLVTRFWYIRPVDQRRTIVTGMTRDGTFLIEGGRITSGVRNLRFNQSIIDALAQCEFSDRQERTGGYSYDSVVPAVKIPAFHFTSGTDF